jgi:hypothetical protein
MHDVKEGRWFLPRGPKSIREELQSTAIREGSEQVGKLLHSKFLVDDT